MKPDFNSIACRVIELADQPIAQRVGVFRRRCPEILRQIRRDAERSGPLPFWARCLNIDEFAGTTIVSPAVLEVLAVTAQRPMSTTRPHAGLQHTYGYLFSVIPTPFGMKRDRWLNDVFERAFRLPSATFGPAPFPGSLLSHATWLAGHFAFRGENRLRRLQRHLAVRITPELRKLPLGESTLRKGSFRLLETVVIATRRTPNVEIQFRTDLIRMPSTIGELSTTPYLLVYSVADSRNRHPQLVTMFATSEEFREEVAARALKRRRSDIRPRYNAFVSGFPSEPQSGRCQLVRWQ